MTGLDNQLCFALYSASSRLNAIYRPILASYGLTYTQFIVLMALWENDSVSISYLAKTTGLTSATMTPLLKLLEKKKFITREIMTGNERQKNIALTPEGKPCQVNVQRLHSKPFMKPGYQEFKLRN